MPRGLLAVALLALLAVLATASASGLAAVCTVYGSRDAAGPPLCRGQLKLSHTTRMLLGSAAARRWQAVTWEAAIYTVATGVCAWIVSFLAMRRRHARHVAGLERELALTRARLRATERELLAAVLSRKEAVAECRSLYGECAKRIRLVLGYVQVGHKASRVDKRHLPPAACSVRAARLSSPP
jgi:hypothetical protein